jgi:hypothetical protein
MPKKRIDTTDRKQLTRREAVKFAGRAAVVAVVTTRQPDVNLITKRPNTTTTTTSETSDS